MVGRSSLDPRASWRRRWGQTWTTGRNRARRTPGIRCPGMGAVVIFLRSGASSGGRPPFAHRALVAWGPSPWTKRGQPRQALCPVWTESTATVDAEAERVVHGRGPPVRRAAVGRRWATRATNHEFVFPGMAPLVPSPDRRLVGGCSPFAHRAFVTWGPSPWTKRGQPAKRCDSFGGSRPRRSGSKPSALSTAYPRSRSPNQKSGGG